jgi:hypothetical protein
VVYIICHKGSFRICNFSHINRSANKTGHALAQLAHIEPKCVWFDEIHPSIVPIISMDLILLLKFSFFNKKTNLICKDSNSNCKLIKKYIKKITYIKLNIFEYSFVKIVELNFRLSF